MTLNFFLSFLSIKTVSGENSLVFPFVFWREKERGHASETGKGRERGRES